MQENVKGLAGTNNRNAITNISALKNNRKINLLGQNGTKLSIKVKKP